MTLHRDNTDYQQLSEWNWRANMQNFCMGARRCVTALLVTGSLMSVTACQKGGSGSKDAPDAKPADASPASDRAKSDDAAKPDADDRGGAAPDALPAVKIEVARIGTVAKLLPLSGTLMAARDQEASISSPIAGVLDRFPLHIGDSVRKGEVIAHVSTASLQGQIEQARAGISQFGIAGEQARVAAQQQQGQTRSAILQAQAAINAAHANVLGAQATLTADQAAVANSQQTFDRVKSLFDQGLVAKKDVEAAELSARAAAAQAAAQQQTIAGLEENLVSQRQALSAAEAGRLQDEVKRKDVDIALAQRSNAQGALATTEAQIALYTVRAPISGVVTAVNANVGESIDTTTKIVTIANLDRLQLNLSVPSAASGAVYVGQPLSFTTDLLPGRTFHASVRTIGTQVDPTNGTITVLAEVDNRDHNLKDDLSVRVGLVTAQHRNVVIVPRSAVFFDPSLPGSEDAASGAASAMRVDSENLIHKVAVTAGLTEGDMVEITSGLKPGDRVASTGGYGLADGTKVKFADATDDAEKKPTGSGSPPPKAGAAKLDNGETKARTKVTSK